MRTAVLISPLNILKDIQLNFFFKIIYFLYIKTLRAVRIETKKGDDV